MGFYRLSGEWESESYLHSEEEAQKQVHDLNGGIKMWVYRLNKGEYEVGYYQPNGYFNVVSRFKDEKEATVKVHFLNGGM